MFDPIDKRTPVPLYYQIRQQIRRLIESGELKPGDRIPTEFDLQARFGVSRNTIRQAISDLVYEGMVERRGSMGTVVAKKKYREGLMGLAGFTSEILRCQGVPENRILSLQRIPCPPDLAEHLQMDAGDLIVAMNRLRIVDGERVGLENWYSPHRLVPTLTESSFDEVGERQSTNFILQHDFHVEITRVIDTVSPVTLEERESGLLEVGKHAPALLRTRLSFTTGNMPVAYSSGVFVTTISTEHGTSDA